MNFKTILVHLDPTQRCGARVVLAANLARAHGGHLVGLLPTGRYDGAIPSGAVPRDAPDLAAASAAWLPHRADHVAEAFRHQMTGMTGVPWEVRRTDRLALEALVAHGRTADLVVMGQEDAHDLPEGASRGLAGKVMLEVGRPVLLVPCFGRFDAIGERVLFAWDGGRAAAVAMRAALPLLNTESRVMVLSLRPAGELDDEEALLPPEQVAWFERQGLHAMVRREIVDDDISEALLSSARDMHADLLVMGGYGHSRWREWMLGGVTQRMLRWMTLPVLFAN
ncbi:universal stress protein [Variovorax rhizosphaerae]|uniref:Universal stress protein n=1 Tax=Variovorax rhizosphaerae TaxID=1836200 RepID=A0ABU8WT01_9BURK